MLIDLHTHTRPLSHDSLLSPDDLIEAAKAAGLDAVCLTEHDFVWDPEAARDLARRHSFRIIPAIEVNTEDGRRQLPFPLRHDGDWSEALERALANPAYRHVRAIETLNGRGSERENAFAAELCSRLGLPAVAASDAHQRDDVGRCATRFERDVTDVASLVHELRAGRFQPVALR